MGGYIVLFLVLYCLLADLVKGFSVRLDNDSMSVTVMLDSRLDPENAFSLIGFCLERSNYRPIDTTERTINAI
ncbi:hypothetical protein N7472_004765 [Penicillium cf. griseofulvum]|uniref:Uncharacterized protein n=1 Tax=Penicillium cf. griseofulvum TaxID=2972120 RepID=A0A9W9JTG1_9EURO|nr:hypothetical protein N7472_004765 [Penicillium cf. griseofulvum]KAJ5442333.1 hypothetical protein N7445_005340 [Penicillium cf. griseofulvum]